MHHPGEPLLPDVLRPHAPTHGRGAARVAPGAGGDACCMILLYAWCVLHAGTCTCMCMACAWHVQAVMRGEWAWAGIPGMRFEMQGGSAVLVTPWGHGTWGVVPSRTDVLVAEFAQQVP